MKGDRQAKPRTDKPSEHQPPSLHICVGPEWEALDAVRDGALAFLRERRVPEANAQAVAMVTCELCENAAKYGTFEPEDTIEVQVTLERAAVTVEVTNPVSASQAERLNRLDGMIQWIRGFQDPFEAYLERLKEVSSQTLDHHESGLGLVRIAYEGQSVLDFFVNEHNVLAVSAVHRLAGQEST
jgi:hypothetical protein